MGESRNSAVAPADARRRLLRAAGISLLVLVALVLLFHVAGGWYFSSVLNERALSAAERRESLLPQYDVDIRAAGEGAITLDARDDDRVARLGTYGLAWDGGYGLLGNVIGESGADVTREFTVLIGGPPAGGTRGEVDSRMYPGGPLGEPVEDVTFDGELGVHEAWFIPGERESWLIFVHGNGMTRADGIRMFDAATASRMPMLVITYRNDEGAPEAPDGRLTYGEHEWRDVESAVQYALNQGAESVVLMGVSMGGGVVTAFLLESELTEHVSGVVLDAPMLDFEAAVEFQAKDESLPLVGLPIPGTLISAAEWFTARRYGLDWDYLDYLDRADELDQPILLFHGTEDETVPIATSEELAERRPDLVRDFVVVEGAGHVESWNVDPDGYLDHVVAFLDSLGLP